MVLPKISTVSVHNFYVLVKNYLIKPNKFGMYVVKKGTYVITSRTVTSGAKKGKISLNILVKLILATCGVTNNTMPTGGVTNPIQRLTTTTMPKCNGLIPIKVAVGLNIGTIIMSAAVKSSREPVINNKIFAINKKRS